jgi:hypothetical protein
MTETVRQPLPPERTVTPAGPRGANPSPTGPAPQEFLIQTLNQRAAVLKQDQASHDDLLKAVDKYCEAAVALGGGQLPEPDKKLGGEPALIVTSIVGLIAGIAGVAGVQISEIQLSAISDLLVFLVPVIISLLGGVAIRQSVKPLPK